MWWREGSTKQLPCGPAKTTGTGCSIFLRKPPRRTRRSNSPRRPTTTPFFLLLLLLLFVAAAVVVARPPTTIGGAAAAAAAFSSCRPTTFAPRTGTQSRRPRAIDRRVIGFTMPPNVNVVPTAPAPVVPLTAQQPSAAAASSTSEAGADKTATKTTAVGEGSVVAKSPTAAIPSNSLSPSVRPLFDRARTLFESTFGGGGDDNDVVDGDEGGGGGGGDKVVASHAPGRVNLIGEHVDYTGGYVFPMAINVGTACYGRGSIVPVPVTSSPSSSSSSPDIDAEDGVDGVAVSPPTVSCRLVSDMFPDHDVVSIRSKTAGELTPFDADSPDRWANYVLGVVREYLPDLPDGHTMKFDLAVAGNVPLGGGLSSSASLEVAVATFLEALLGARHAYSSSSSSSTTAAGGGLTEKEIKIERALRSQRAEREFAGTPCGIMDQFVSSAAEPGSVLLIDCRAVDYEGYRMGSGGGGEAQAPGGGGGEDVRVVICNSMVKHDNAGGEYPKRVEQCRVATEALRQIHPEKRIESLRDATLQDVEEARTSMDDVTYRRARHVVTENERTVRAAEAWREGDFDTVGKLMDESHVSMRDDYETSCEEIDVLVELAQSYPGGGVYGSRLTGGGFGGCTVTLVKSSEVDGLIRHLRRGYRERFPDLMVGGEEGGRCECFETSPEDGARVIEV